MGPVWLRAILLGLGLILLALAILARRPGDAIWHWQATLLATEFGHFLALICLGAGLCLAWAWPAVRFWGLGVSVLLAASYLEPLIRASQEERSVSMARAFFPWIGVRGEAVEVTRESVREGQEMVICRPASANREGAALPWVISVHGGGWNGGRPDEFLNWDRELASHGVVVLMPTYRLAPQHRWPAPGEDLEAVAAWGRENADRLGIDPEDLTILGRSAGGQIGTAVAYGSGEIGARRVMAFYAPQDMFFAWKYARPDDTLDSVSLLEDYLGGAPEGREDLYESASPIRLIDGNTPPTLLIHGSRDSLVWVKQSRRLAEKLRSEGTEATFLELPWATHACDYFPWSPGGQVAMLATRRFLSEG